jgi:hypothetical protein
MFQTATSAMSPSKNWIGDASLSAPTENPVRLDETLTVDALVPLFAPFR